MNLSRLAAAVLLATAAPLALADLKMGADAPDFSTQVALDGKVSDFKLSDALKSGPVVLYFYPKSFTSGCTKEAHLFAEATDRYAALGARVIGVSSDDVETQKKFSVAECRSKFPVAADADQHIIKAYDAGMMMFPGHASRVSYVITPDRKVNYVYSAMNPDEHVNNTLAALEKWRAAHPKAK